MRTIYSVALILVLATALVAKESPSQKIKKIILLCMENHSYDNMVTAKRN